MRPFSAHEISRLRGTTPVHQLDDLVRRCEVQLPGQGSLQILFQELAVVKNVHISTQCDSVRGKPGAISGFRTHFIVSCEA
jgi:hypothetical protein